MPLAPLPARMFVTFSLLVSVTFANSAPDAASFNARIRPILQEHCLECHSTAKHKGDLDLERFDSETRAGQNPEVWEAVVEQIQLGEMPPKDAKALPTADRDLLLSWTEALLQRVALERAGDPGPVVLRRLSNAEYRYTLRDLTSVPTLDPTAGFPGDSAAGEGFMNVGQALVISPSLLTKYLDAAKSVATHAVLLPHGIRFSHATTRRDWTEEILTNIRTFYARYTEPGGGTAVNLQGIKFDTRDGGVLPLATYLDTLLTSRAGTPATQRPDHTPHLSPKYLAQLRAALNQSNASPVLDSLRARWHQAVPGDGPSLAHSIARWQQALWRFNSVGHIGKLNGPPAWLEPVNPLQPSQELRHRPPSATNNSTARFFIAATDAADGSQGDFVLLQRPRFVAPGKPDLLLADVQQVYHELVPSLPAAHAFGRHPNGNPIAPHDLCFHAPTTLEIQVPAELIAGREFITTASLHPETGAEGSVQLEIHNDRPTNTQALTPAAIAPGSARATWTDPDRPPAHTAPILVQDHSPARRRFEAAFDEFRDLFPAALCYTKIVPVDEVVTLTLFHREDRHLARLLLEPAEVAALDQLWDELHYVSQDALTLVDAFEQLWQYATQDADPKVFEPMRAPITARATAFRQQLQQTEPAHLDAALEFAARAHRRPLNPEERDNLLALYRTLRTQELDHDAAVRMLLARTLTSPAFLYRAETAPPGSRQGPVNDYELATRLSYFLWSSIPDDSLRADATAGRLRDPEVLVTHMRRMLRDERARRLATEFACAWLHVYDFHELSEKSERHFPDFNTLRGAMYEETIRFFTDLFQNNRSVLDILTADHTFVNGDLAAFYGVPGVSGPEWRRVEAMKSRGRGGILGQATTLAKQSGASRTSPILRGNWLSEVLLGDKLPRPPRNVPQLPEDEAASERTQRELVERHSSDPNCIGCHRRIDPYGFALEAFDAIGRHRTNDLAGRPVDTHARTLEGAEFDGLEGLRDYLLTRRRDAFVKQFCRKLLGYALGRSVLLSDAPLVADMRRQLEANNHHVAAAIETIVRSRQFREIRGRDGTPDLAHSH